MKAPASLAGVLCIGALLVACGQDDDPATHAAQPTTGVNPGVSTTAGALDAAAPMSDATLAAPHDAGGAPPGEAGATPGVDAGGTGSDGGGALVDAGGGGAASSVALAELQAWLGTPRATRGRAAEQPFGEVPLTAADAEQAASLLWEDYASHVRETRAGEVGATRSRAASFALDGSVLRYYQAEVGEQPASGRSLFISMHGGGNAAAATNDSQWENQIALVDGYAPTDALWVAPRAPNNEWNMWFTPDVDALFDRLITNLIVFAGVDPNRVYLTGYSAGGDGVYQLGPRMADRWAGAGMSAGHPNAASPVNLRNVAFAIHVGGNDTAYDRNLKGAEWGEKLQALAASDGEGGYPVQWEVHPGLPHWMNLADAVSIPFLQDHVRDPVPAKVVWRQADVLHERFYWLAVDAGTAQKDTQVVARREGHTITLSEVEGLTHLRVRVSDAMLDLDQPVQVVDESGTLLWNGRVDRTVAVVERTLEERGDPALMFYGELRVEL